MMYIFHRFALAITIVSALCLLAALAYAEAPQVNAPSTVAGNNGATVATGAQDADPTPHNIQVRQMPTYEGDIPFNGAQQQLQPPHGQQLNTVSPAAGRQYPASPSGTLATDLDARYPATQQ